MGVLDKLEVMAAFANDAANGTLLLAIAVVALILAAVGVVWLRGRLNRLPARPPRQDGDQDQVEQFLADVLKYEADQQERRGRRRGERDR